MSKKGVAPPAPAVPAKGKFDAKSYAKNGVTEEEVTACKQAFDLFDSDQGGSVDIKGNHKLTQNSRQQ
jgi:Ca2+-binding EF-hand superfamily protein